MTSFCDFMQQSVGAKWVVARRTPRIIAKYGDDVVCLSPSRYRALSAEYEARNQS